MSVYTACCRLLSNTIRKTPAIFLEQSPTTTVNERQPTYSDFNHFLTTLAEYNDASNTLNQSLFSQNSQLLVTLVKHEVGVR